MFLIMSIAFKRVKALADGIVVRILDKNSDRWMSKSKMALTLMMIMISKYEF